MGKDILTTGNVARICNVSPAAVGKWFDKGLLEGFKVPGSRHRRILPKSFVQFLKDRKVPYDKAALRELQLTDSCSD